MRTAPSNTSRLLAAKSFRGFVLTALVVATSSAAWANNERSAKFYEDALRREAANDLAGATVNLKNALKLDGKNLAAHLLLGKLLKRQGELKAAEAAFEEALRLGVSKLEVAVPLGEIYLQLGNTHKLIDTISPVGLPATVQAEVLTLRAGAYALNGNSAQAAKSLADARVADPQSALPDMAEAPILLRAGEPDKARDMARRATVRAPGSATAWFNLGTVLFSTGDLPGALTAFDRALAINDRHVDSRVSRASILFAQGRKADAAAELKTLKDGNAREPRASFLRALLADERGDSKTARTEYTEAANLVDAISPNVLAANEPLMMAGALSHRALGNREKTRQYAESVLSRNPRHQAATMVLAEEMLRSNETSRAAPLIESLLRQSPNDPQALFMMGHLHMARRQYDKAAEVLDRASKQASSLPALRDLSFSQFALGQDRLALANLEKAYTANRKDTRAGMELAVFYARSGNAKRAVEVAEEMVALQPDNLAMLNFLGNVKGRLRDMKGLKEAYERALAKDPKFKPVVQNMSWFDMEEGRLDQARQRLRNFLKDSPQDAEVLHQAGVLESMSGRQTEALALWAQSDQNNPKDPRSLLAIMDTHVQSNRLDDAVVAAKTLQARFPDVPFALMAAARAFAAKGDTTTARLVLQDAVSKAGFDPEPLVSISRQLSQIGALDEAGHALTKALQGAPNEPQALALRVELASRRGQPAEVDKALAALQAKHPTLPITLVTAGHVAFGRNQPARAVGFYKQVFDREPTTSLALNLAQAHAANREPDKGVALLEAWSRKVPRDLVAQRALADMQMFAGQMDAARKGYAALVQAQPNDAGLLLAQARMLARMGDPAALGAAEKAFRLAPGQTAVADTYGWLLLRSGNTEASVRVLREARLRDPANGVLRWHLAAALAKAGRRGEAVEELRAALGAKPPVPADPELDKLRKDLGL